MGKHRTRYRQSPTVIPTEYMRWIRKRCEWAAKEAMVKSEAIRSVRWEWSRRLAYKDRGDSEWCGLFGRVKYGARGPTIVISTASDDHWQDTATHEYAHALLASVEGLRQRGPLDVDESSHSPAWAALYGDIYQRFTDMGRSGPQQPEED